jgi:hypothetical protein
MSEKMAIGFIPSHKNGFVCAGEKDNKVSAGQPDEILCAHQRLQMRVARFSAAQRGSSQRQAKTKATKDESDCSSLEQDVDEDIGDSEAKRCPARANQRKAGRPQFLRKR